MPWPFSSRDVAPVERREIPLMAGMDAQRSTPAHEKRSSFLLGTSGARFMSRNPTVFATEGYCQNVVAFACIRLIAQAAGSVELQLEQGPKAKIVASHPILDLFARPNQLLSGPEFMEALIAHRLIYGNAFVTSIAPATGKNANKPAELWLLQPDKTKIHVRQTETGISVPVSFEYAPGGGVNKLFPIDPLTGACAVAHLKTFNPIALHLGLSPMEAAAYSIDTHTATLSWNKALLDNAAMPSGALVMRSSDGKSGTLTEEQFSSLKREIAESFSGPANARKPPVLEGGLEWQQLSMSPIDMDFQNGLWASAMHICMAYGVPPQMLGVPGSQTHANFEQARLQFWQDAVLPALYGALATLNLWLAPQFGDDTLRLQPDEDSISALEPIRQIRYDRARLADYLTVDEKREMAGYGPLPNKEGAVVLVNAAQMPLDMLGADLTSLTNPPKLDPAGDTVAGAA